MVKNRKTAELLGQILAGKYHLEKLIGEGGFGAVFRALDSSSQQSYAIKILYPNEGMPPAQKAKEWQYFQREIGTLARVRHPNIVSIYHGGLTEHGLPYLVMEMAEGELLSNLLRKEGHLSLMRVAQIFSQLCPAVAAMHEQAIIHRDLKPDNIMVRQDEGDIETVKLLDFGLAKLLRGENDEQWLRTITGRGQVHGTIFYMSPEQCEARKLDERTDIYSLGVIAYELLAGQPPFRAASPLGIMMAHLDSLPPPLRATRPDLPVEAEIAILKAMEKDPDKRYAGAVEFSQSLESIAAQCALAQLKAGGNPNAQFESAARTEAIRIDDHKLTAELDPQELEEEDPQENQPTRRMSRFMGIIQKLKGE